MKEYSSHWRSSVRPAKQRKFRVNAPLHIKRSFMAVHLAKPLRKEHKRRSVLVRIGDKVKIARGTFRGNSGKVENVDTLHEKVYITGIEHDKKDGSKALYPHHPSNLIIEELNMQDKRRFTHAQKTAKVAPVKKEQKKPQKAEKTA